MEFKLKELPFELIDKIYLYVIFKPRTCEQLKKAVGEYCSAVFDEELSEKMVKYLFAPRNSIDPAEAYRLFRGRDADVNALKRDRGF